MLAETLAEILKLEDTLAETDAELLAETEALMDGDEETEELTEALIDGDEETEAEIEEDIDALALPNAVSPCSRTSKSEIGIVYKLQISYKNPPHASFVVVLFGPPYLSPVEPIIT